MHNNLPSTVDRGTYALDPQAGTEVVSAEYLPNIEGYQTVCVQVRESQLIATNQPAVINYTHVQAPPQVYGSQYGSQYGGQYGGPQAGQYAGGQYVPPGAVPPGAPGFGTVSPRKGPTRRNVIGWICVSQLAVIIGLIGFQNTHLDYKGSIGRMTDSALMSGDALRVLFNNSVAAPLGLNSSIAPEAPSKKLTAKSKVKGAVKTASRSKGHGVHMANGFIPPPPPGFAMPKSNMMVPPPPVAYALNASGPGAVAASTLPSLSSNAVAQQAKKAAPKAEAETVPTHHSPAPKEAGETTVATAPHAVVEDPGPEWFGTLPNAPFSDKETASAPSVQEFKAPALATPVYNAPVATAPTYHAPAPNASAYRAPAESHVSASMPAHRTVMSGKRQRIIADR